MHLQLLIPGLLWPEAISALPTSSLPTLELLLARGRRKKAAAPDAMTWLFEAYDVAGQEASKHDHRAAAFARLGDGGTPDAACWMCADPVHLRLQRDALLLADATLLAISRDEANALVASLNAHFAADGFALQAPHPDRWYAALAQAPDLTTTALTLAAGQSVDPNLPGGADAAAWHARMNEVQMLLHAHPVNEAREARGQMPVNSLWFWGAGELPVRDQDALQPFARVWAANPVACGLARWSGATAQSLPPSAKTLLDLAPAEGAGLVVLDGLDAARAYGDLGAWDTHLRELESGWLAPLLAALRGQRIGMLSVHGLGGDKGFNLEVARQDLSRFWRRPKALTKQLA